MRCPFEANPLNATVLRRPWRGRRAGKGRAPRSLSFPLSISWPLMRLKVGHSRFVYIALTPKTKEQHRAIHVIDLRGRIDLRTRQERPRNAADRRQAYGLQPRTRWGKDRWRGSEEHGVGNHRAHYQREAEHSRRSFRRVKGATWWVLSHRCSRSRCSARRREEGTRSSGWVHRDSPGSRTLGERRR